MKTVLDEARSWFLETLTYTDELLVVVAERIRSDEPEGFRVGSHRIENTHALQPTTESRRVNVRFPRTVAWQVIDECYTTMDESEIRDDAGFLVTLAHSAYLRYVQENHGWFREVAGPAVHYRPWTENQVIDVVAHGEPVLHFRDT